MLLKKVLEDWFLPIVKLQKADKKFFLLTAFLFCTIGIIQYVFFLAFTQFIDEVIVARAIGTMPTALRFVIWKMIALVFLYRILKHVALSFDGISKIAGLRMMHLLSLSLFSFFVIARFPIFGAVIFLLALAITFFDRQTIKFSALIFQTIILLYLISKLSLAIVYQHIDFASAISLILAILFLFIHTIDDKQKSR